MEWEREEVTLMTVFSSSCCVECGGESLVRDDGNLN